MQQRSILNQPIFDPGLDTFFLHHLVIANSLKPQAWAKEETSVQQG